MRVPLVAVLLLGVAPVDGVGGARRAVALVSSATAQCTPLDVFAATVASPALVRGGVDDVDGRFGAAVGFGDFNGDTRVDLAVGAPGYPVGGARSGAVFLYAGSGRGWSPWMILTQAAGGGADEAGDEFGAAVAGGDFNGDGHAEVAVGAPGERLAGLPTAGAIYVFNGSATGPARGRWYGQRVAGGANEAGDRFGASLAPGNLTGDRYTDLAVGAPGEAPVSDPASGAVYLVRGSAGGLSTGSYRTQEHAGGHNDAADRFGHSVAVGRTDADSLDDVIVGAPGDLAAAGTVYRFPGSAVLAMPGRLLRQRHGGGVSEAGDQFGASVAIGDFNGDGHGDAAVGTPGEAPGRAPSGGAFFVFVGGGSGLTTGSFFDQRSADDAVELADRFGTSVAAADLDRDGKADLAVGSPGESRSGEGGSGVLFLYAGSQTGVTTGRGLSPRDLGSSGEAGSQFGAALAAGRDATGAALAAGAPGPSSPGRLAGTVGVYRGLQPALTHGPIVGAATDRDIRVLARSARAGMMRVQYREAGTQTWRSTPTVSFGASRDNTATVALTDLRADTRYEYRVVVDCAVDALTTSIVKTRPAASRSGHVSFVVAADLSPRYSFRGLSVARQADPDLALLIGDIVYADQDGAARTKSQYEAKYRRNLADGHSRALVRETPTAFMWDDHEIANDWSAGMSGLYAEARPAYEAYANSVNPPARVSGELYYTLAAGPADLFVMDTRTHRSPNGSPDDADKTMLGSVQKAEVKAWLRASTAPFKFLVSTVPFNDNATTGDDSWSGFRTERAELFSYIRDNDVSGVVLISGDQHWAGAFRTPDVLGYDLIEFQPSPIAAVNRPMPVVDSPSVLHMSDKHRLFGLFAVDATTSPAAMTITFIDEFGHTRYSVKVSSAELHAPARSAPSRDLG
jgi:hypothetical protein